MRQKEELRTMHSVETVPADSRDTGWSLVLFLLSNVVTASISLLFTFKIKETSFPYLAIVLCGLIL